MDQDEAKEKAKALNEHVYPLLFRQGSRSMGAFKVARSVYPALESVRNLLLSVNGVPDANLDTQGGLEKTHLIEQLTDIMLNLDDYAMTFESMNLGNILNPFTVQRLRDLYLDYRTHLLEVAAGNAQFNENLPFRLTLLEWIDAMEGHPELESLPSNVEAAYTRLVEITRRVNLFLCGERFLSLMDALGKTFENLAEIQHKFNQNQASIRRYAASLPQFISRLVDLTSDIRRFLPQVNYAYFNDQTMRDTMQGLETELQNIDTAFDAIPLYTDFLQEKVETARKMLESAGRRV